MKILSVNLWFEKYGHKTIAQLKAFSHYNYDTYAATILEEDISLKCEIYKVDFPGNVLTTISTKAIKKEPFGIAYFAAFRFLYDYAYDNDFDIVYMRRLMSKIAYAGPHFKHLSGKCALVYEIPTFPFDVPANFLYALRDKLELLIYKRCRKHIAVTSTCLYQHGKVSKDWLLFENGIDIDNYTHHNVPPLEPVSSEASNKDNTTVNFLMIANMQVWHRSERILYAIKNYSGKYNIHLTVASPESKEYSDMKDLAKELSIDSLIDFNGFLNIKEIDEIAENCHLAVGQLSGSEYGVMETHAIKHKDYCGLSLPMFSTCTDTSFPKDYPYYYFLEDTDADIDLAKIIDWYLNIRNNHPNYREEMYNHAKDNLQYDGYVKKYLMGRKHL